MAGCASISLMVLELKVALDMWNHSFILHIPLQTLSSDCTLKSTGKEKTRRLLQALRLEVLCSHKLWLWGLLTWSGGAHLNWPLRLLSSLSGRSFHFHLSSFAISKEEIGRYMLPKTPKLCFLHYTCLISLKAALNFYLKPTMFKDFFSPHLHTWGTPWEYNIRKVLNT